MNKEHLTSYIDTLAKIRDGHPWQIFDNNWQWRDAQENDDPLNHDSDGIRLVDLHRELKAAREAGKTIQILILGEWTDISKHEVVYWTYPPKEYRIKPEDPYSELKAAQAAGEIIQFDVDGQWENWKPSLGWRSPLHYYRIKPEPVHLSPEDVPPGSVIKPMGWDKNQYVNYEAVVTGGIRTIGKDWGEFRNIHGYLSWAELASDWQINRSLSLGGWDPEAWEPCTKEV